MLILIITIVSLIAASLVFCKLTAKRYTSRQRSGASTANSAAQHKKHDTTLWDEVKFFVDANKKMPRDYTILIDCSGSMSAKEPWWWNPWCSPRWEIARDG